MIDGHERTLRYKRQQHVLAVLFIHNTYDTVIYMLLPKVSDTCAVIRISEHKTSVDFSLVCPAAVFYRCFLVPVFFHTH